MGRGGLAAFGCRAIAAIIACASVFQGCCCPSSGASSSGCSGGGSSGGCGSGGGGCESSTPPPCYGPYCDAGPGRDAGSPHADAGHDAGPSAFCAAGVCNVLSNEGCPAMSACRLPIAGTDAGARDADVDGASDAAMELDAGDVDAGHVDAGDDVDAGDVDAGDVDAGDVDAGDVDAGDVDAGDVDAGDVDASDLGSPLADAGPRGPTLVCEPFGTGRSDAPCVGDDDCAQGFMCLPLVGGARCRAYCCGGDGCPFGEECRYELTPGIQLCSAFVECNPAAQTGCLPDWECNVWDDHRTGCDALGVLPASATCATRFDCAPGLGCGPAGASVCRRYCSPTDPTSCGGGYCSPTELGYGLCYPSPDGPCDALHQLDCPDGTSCYPDALDHLQCARTGTIPIGLPCHRLTDCVAGAVCTSATGPLSCVPLCSIATGSPCGGATHCTHMPGYPRGIGACQ